MAKEIVKLCVDAAKGKVQNYSESQANDVIRKAFTDIIGTDKIDYRTFRRVKNDVFEIIEDVLDLLIVDGWANNTFFDQFVEVKDVNLGDKNEFYVEDRSMLLVSKFSGNHWDLRRQKLNIGQSFSVSTDFYGVSIYADFARFLAGRIDWTRFVEKVYEAFNNKVKDMIYTTFAGVDQYLPAEFKESGALTADNLRTVCEHVSAANGGSYPIIAGTKAALSKIDNTITSGWVSDTMKNRKNETGIVPIWEGYTLMPIPQSHAFNTFEFVLDDSKLFILPQNNKCIKLVNEGQPLVREVSDGTRNVDASIEYEFVKKFGVGVVFNVLFGQYTIA